MSLKSIIFAGISARLASTPDLGAAEYKVEGSLPTVSLLSGTTDGKADRLYTDRGSIAASGSANVDLAGTLVDALGQACVFAKVKALLIKAAVGNTNNLIVGDGATPFDGPLGGTDPTLTLPPGGVVLLAAPDEGWPVAAGTGDILKLANSGAGTAVEYEITIVGTSA